MASSPQDVLAAFRASRAGHGSPAPPEAPTESEAAVAAALEAAWRQGRARWPGVELDAARFAEHLGARVPGGVPSEQGIAALHVEDLYLACACQHDLPGALRAFDHALLARVPAIVGHLRLAPVLVDEVRQATRARLFVADAGQPPRIAAYAGRAALAVWLRATVVRVALNLLDAERRRPTATDDERLFERVAQGTGGAHPEPELQLVKHLDRAAVHAAFVAALGQLQPAQRNLLRLHYVEGLAMSEIGAMATVHKATISRRLAQAEADLAARMRAALGEQLRLPEAEVESLIDLVLSQLDLSLPGLLPRE